MYLRIDLWNQMIINIMDEGTGLYLMVLKIPEIVFALRGNSKVSKIHFKVNYLIKQHY